MNSSVLRNRWDSVQLKFKVHIQFYGEVWKSFNVKFYFIHKIHVYVVHGSFHEEK